MFNNKLLSDIMFLVGPAGKSKLVKELHKHLIKMNNHIMIFLGSALCIPAHKYVLAIGSSVFFAMFNGNLAEQKEKIVIPDVEPTAFLNLLR